MRTHRFEMSLLNLPVTFFQERKQWVAYTPVLDFSSAGDTLQEAQKNFGEAVRLFFEECLRKGTLEEVLKSCGWNKVSRPKPHFEPPANVLQSFQSVSVPIPA